MNSRKPRITTTTTSFRKSYNGYENDSSEFTSQSFEYQDLIPSSSGSEWNERSFQPSFPRQVSSKKQEPTLVLSESRSTQYTKRTSISSCTVQSLEAALQLQYGRLVTEKLVDEILERGNLYQLNEHTGVDDIYPGVQRYNKYLRIDSDQQVHVRNIRKYLEEQMRTSINRPKSIVVTKPPESFLLHLDSTNSRYVLFDSHKIEGFVENSAAGFLIYHKLDDLIRYLENTRMRPIDELDTYQDMQINVFQATVVVRSQNDVSTRVLQNTDDQFLKDMQRLSNPSSSSSSSSVHGVNNNSHPSTRLHSSAPKSSSSSTRERKERANLHPQNDEGNDDLQRAICLSLQQQEKEKQKREMDEKEKQSVARKRNKMDEKEVRRRAKIREIELFLKEDNEDDTNRLRHLIQTNKLEGIIQNFIGELYEEDMQDKEGMIFALEMLLDQKSPRQVFDEIDRLQMLVETSETEVAELSNFSLRILGLGLHKFLEEAVKNSSTSRKIEEYRDKLETFKAYIPKLL